MAGPGRRPGNADTRGEILRAARQEFAARGYGGATIRGIAARAEVDPALVHHYFGTKRELFVTSLALPFDPLEVISAAVPGDPGKAGERLLRMLLGVWATEPGQTLMQSLLRSALTDDEVLGTLRQFMLETVLAPIVREVAPDRPELRAALLASQILGLAVVRHVTKIEPLASAEADTVVAAVGPTVQRYLTENLGPS